MLRENDMPPNGLRAVCLPLILSLLAGCSPKSTPSPSSAHPPSNQWFRNVADELGIHCILGTSSSISPQQQYEMTRSIGSGAALFDYDLDGRLDIYIVHTNPINTPTNSSTHALANRLYQQQPDGTFMDVSASSGLVVTGPGMGVAAGDLTNDGFPEILLTEFQQTRLFHNQGNGTFVEVSQFSGIENTGWGTSAAMVDYDRDGWLDVVIANYVDYSPDNACYDTLGAQEFCGPQGMTGTVTKLFRNLGQSSNAPRFQDVTVQSGLARHPGPAMGVLAVDLTGDTWPDLLLADDGEANRLFVNQHDGTFLEEALMRGLAFNAFGSPVANMGIAYGDFDGNHWPDVLITHLSHEQPGLWMQGPAGWFQDQAASAELGRLDWHGTGFGTVCADFDLDGDLDLAIANGDIKRISSPGPFLPGQSPFWNHYAQRNQLLANDGSGSFVDVSQDQPAFSGQAGVSRGLACGDVNNDGSLDLLVINMGGPVQLMQNQNNHKGHWLMLQITNPAWGDRDAYGAVVTIHADNRQWQRTVQPGSSYLVSHDPRIHVGLGPVERVDRIEVLWPNGDRESFPAAKANQLLRLRKGAGLP